MNSHESTEDASVVDTIIIPPTRDLGDGFTVQRALPSAQRRMVGPFVFFDQMGPTILKNNAGLDVRPHPHIGLATVTYLLQGELMHQDSLGTVQTIRPGELNWMTAGSGIVHSERTPAEIRNHGSNLFGIQSWVALPESSEEIDANFTHIDASDLPIIEGGGAHVKLIAGTLFNATAPVPIYSPMFYADVTLNAGATLLLSADYQQRAFYLLDGEISIAHEPIFQPSQLVVLRSGVAVSLKASNAKPARLLLLGGEPIGPRYVWWNFVSSRKERIEQAKADWKEDRFAKVNGETEFIPLPESTPKTVSYP